MCKVKINIISKDLTYFPSQSPMDEVINLMEQCIGTIVLVYPQIVLETGQIIFLS